MKIFKVIPMAICLVTTVTPIWSQQFFYSNAIGQKVQEIKGGGRPILTNEEYILEVIEGNTITRELLYNFSELIRETNTVFGQSGTIVSTIEHGILVRREQYATDGSLISEERYNPEGELLERREYSYDGHTTTITVRDNTTDIIYTEQHTTNVDGYIGEVTKRYTDGANTTTRYLYYNNILLQEIHYLDARTIVYDYDTQGRKVRERELMDGELIKDNTISYDYGNSSDKPTRSVTYALTNRQVVVGEIIEFDDAGYQKSLLTSENNIPIAVQDNNYVDGRLLKKETATNSDRETVEYQYDDDGILSIEQWKRDGQLVRRREYTIDGDYTETLYQNNQPIVEQSFEDGVKVNETLFKHYDD